MNLYVVTLWIRMGLLALLAASFILEYKSTKIREEIIVNLKDTIAFQKRTIEAQAKNIAIRKDKMGH